MAPVQSTLSFHRHRPTRVDIPSLEQPPSLKQPASLARPRSATPDQAAGRDRGCCLTFHRAVPSTRWATLPNRGFHLDLDFLERLIGYLRRRHWDIVTMDEALRRSAQPGSRRYVNFSIDDCYRDTAELVVPLFQRLQAPVTLFVTTGIPDGTMRLRDAGLETILAERDQVDEAGVAFRLDTPRAKRAAFATISRQWDVPGGDDAYLRFCERHGYDVDALERQHAISWPMLEALRDDPLVEIGAHTISHLRISALPTGQARAELAGSKARLEERMRRPVRHFAFPFGRQADCGARDFALAREAGFDSAATTTKGLVRPRSDPFRIPRNTLNGTNRRVLFAKAHLSGLTGFAAQVSGRD